MPHSSPTTEILAPASGFALLRAALDAGADAVYFGLDRLNMRARAKNFTLGHLSDVVSQIHNADANAYLTLNSLIFESEIADVTQLLQASKEAGVDAVIAADWAVIRMARQTGIPVHVSTQMSVSNSQTLAFLFELGIRRVVLARECGLQDIQDMQQALRNEFASQEGEMEFEVFAHGAMCVAESGRCFLSGFETGRSASRGDCAQPCRRPYRIESDRGGEGFEIEDPYILSPRDLCTLPFLDQILDAGVRSLKIEGRNRTPDYVYTVVSAYRQAVDVYEEFRGTPQFRQRFESAQQKGIERVQQVYNRGFSNGFYLGRPMKAWTTAPGNQATSRRQYIGQVLKNVPSEKRIRLRLESTGLAVGDPVFAEGPQTGFRELTIQTLRQNGKPVEKAAKGEEVDLIAGIPLHPADRIYRHVRAVTG